LTESRQSQRKGPGRQRLEVDLRGGFTAFLRISSDDEAARNPAEAVSVNSEISGGIGRNPERPWMEIQTEIQMGIWIAR